MKKLTFGALDLRQSDSFELSQVLFFLSKRAVREKETRKIFKVPINRMTETRISTQVTYDVFLTTNYDSLLYQKRMYRGLSNNKECLDRSTA